MDEAALHDTDVLAKLLNPAPDMEIPTDKTQLTSCQLSAQTYWNSTEARHLFGSQTGDKNACLTLNQKIEILKSVNQKVAGYHNVIKGHDPHNVCTQAQNFKI